MKDYPVVKFTILFIIGILLEKIWEINTLIYFSLFFGFCIFVGSSFRFKIFSKTAPFISTGLFVMIILTGNYIATINQNHYQFLSPHLYKVKNLKAFGTVEEIDLKKSYEVKFVLDVDSVKYKGNIIRHSVKLYCQLRFDDKNKLENYYQTLLPGNYISLMGNFKIGNQERNPGEFDYNKYLHSEGISGLLTSYNANDLKILMHRKNIFNAAIFSVRKTLDNEINKLQKPKTAALLRGLLLADRSEIDYSTRTEFVNSGVIHVLAVSGLHVGYIIIIFLVVFGRLNIYLRSIITIVGLILFMLITGIPASVTRATIMAIVIFIAILSNRSSNIFNSLAIAALIILVFEPAQLYKPGFQMSFSAVLSIAAIFPALQKKINKSRIRNKFVKYILLFMAVSLSAEIGTLPFTLIYFGKLSLIALFANLIVIPLIGVILAVAIFTMLIYPVIPTIAFYYAVANDLLTKILYSIIHFSGTLDFSFIWIRHFTLFDTLAFYTFLIILLLSINKFKNRLAVSLMLVLVFANILVYDSIDSKDMLPKNKLSIMMIDVGQGDSFLLKFPDGKTALIDAGNATRYYDNGERVILPLLNYLNISRIDYGFVSHVDADHYGGFISLIHHHKIKKIYKPVIDSSKSKDIRFEKYLHQNHIPIKYYNKGIIKIGDVNLYVLDFENNKLYRKFSNNNKSGLIKIDFGKTSYLFTGDMEKRAEKFYIKAYHKFLDVDVLKVGHHGSKTSSSQFFLQNTTPHIALVSVGRQNRYHHPSQSVIQRLKSDRAIVYRTDKMGAILLRSDGYNIKKIDWRNYY